MILPLSEYHYEILNNNNTLAELYKAQVVATVGVNLNFAKLSPSPSEAGLSKLYNHGGTANRRPPTTTANCQPPPPEHQKANF